IYTADVQKAWLLPESPLQEPRSRVLVVSRDGRAKIPAMVERCGYKVAGIRRVQVGAMSLGSMEEGQLQAASAEEEVWACQLAGLQAKDYPEGFLPEGSKEGKKKFRRKQKQIGRG
ncbi:unnamed protein product, partial [Effrenium voratum]